MLPVFSIITGIVGGVALFLFGMNVLSTSLTMLAGGHFETMLEKFTDKPIKGWLLATLITSIVQSSSATTVLTVGLVNSGILELTQSVSLIIGANLGTTATAWILSLNSIKGDSLILNLLSPSTFSQYLAIIGVAMQMFAKSEKKKNIGGILIGFSTMMIGMNLMSNAVTPLKQDLDFDNMLTKFSNPLLIFFVAVIFTLIIQSSDATVGMLQALCMSIKINALIAIPIICGAQIGTCISAILSSLATGKNGKRTALIQLYYNLIKNVPFIIFFYFFSVSEFGSMLKINMTPIKIAAFHTSINLVFSLIMLPLSGFLVFLALKTIPYTEGELKSQKAKLSNLDPIFLKNPSYAIMQTKDSLKTISESVGDAFKAYIEKDFEVMKEKIDLIDGYSHAIKNYMNKITQRHISAQESSNLDSIRIVCMDYQMINDRMRDLYDSEITLSKKGLSFTDATQKELNTFAEATMDILSIAMGGIITDSSSVSVTIKCFREVISELHSEIQSRYLKRLHNNLCNRDASMYFTEICYNYERIIERCDDIGSELTQISVQKNNTNPIYDSSYDVIKKLFSDKYSVGLQNDD